MRTVLEFAGLLLTIITLGPAMAHALEYRGRMSLNKEEYSSVQRIYYPEFMYAVLAEPLAIIVLSGLLALTPQSSSDFWLIMGALLSAAVTHSIYWARTAPVDRIWLKKQTLPRIARLIFGTRRNHIAAGDWRELRSRWERSHVYRALSTGVGFALLLSAFLE